MTIIDVIVPSTGLSLIGRKNLAHIRREYGDHIEIADFETACDLCEDARRSGPEEITEKTWWEMLCVLPPEDRSGGDNTDSFKLGEAEYGPITGIYCRIGSRYFRLYDHKNMPHAEIVAQCEAFMKGS